MHKSAVECASDAENMKHAKTNEFYSKIHATTYIFLLEGCALTGGARPGQTN